MSLPDYAWLKEQIFDSEEGQANIRKAQELEGVARELGISMAQMAIAWCLKNRNVSTVILGATNVNQLTENLASLEKAELLTEPVMEKIEAVLGNRPELPQQL